LRLAAGLPIISLVNEEPDMIAIKRCIQCRAEYRPGHWAFDRENCPLCGAGLVGTTDEPAGLAYQHYDSSADLRFDTDGLLSPERLREARVALITGLVLIGLAFAARLTFVLVGKSEGFWGVPLWFDVLVGVMIFLGSITAVWAALRILRHHKRMKS